MNTGEELKKAIRGKGLTMDEAAEKLEISRGTLFYKLKGADTDKEFVQLVQERLGINVDMPERSSHAVGVQEKKIGNTAMKYQTVPLKDRRVIEMWIPADFSKSDVASLKQWLAYYESTL